MLAVVSALIAAAHPSLFFGSSDVPALRQAAQTTHASIASHITAVLDQHLSDPTPSPSEYDDFRFLGNQVAVWAFGYQLTGKAQYAAIARSQLLTYAGWSTWDNGETASLGGPDLAEAHMLLGTSIAYDWIYETLSAADRATIANKIGAEAQRVAAYLPNAWWVDQYLQNHNWIDTAGLGMAALALQGEDARASGWLSLVQNDLEKLKVTIGQIPDGSWHEGLPYEGYGLAMALPFWQAMRHAGADYTDMGLLRGYGTILLYAGTADDPKQVILPFGDFTHWPGWQAVQIARFLGLPLSRRVRRGGGAALHRCRGPGHVPAGGLVRRLRVHRLRPDGRGRGPAYPAARRRVQRHWRGHAAQHLEQRRFRARVQGDGLRRSDELQPAGGAGVAGRRLDRLGTRPQRRHELLAVRQGRVAGAGGDGLRRGQEHRLHVSGEPDRVPQRAPRRRNRAARRRPDLRLQLEQSLVLQPHLAAAARADGHADYAIAGGKGAQLFASTLGISRWTASWCSRAAGMHWSATTWRRPPPTTTTGPATSTTASRSTPRRGGCRGRERAANPWASACSRLPRGPRPPGHRRPS